MGIVIERSDNGWQTTITAPTTTIGREGTDIAINHKSISRMHARIFRLGDETTIEDAGSRNGTAVNGKKLGVGERVQLVPGAVVRLGDSIELKVLDAEAKPEAAKETSHTVEAEPDALIAQTKSGAVQAAALIELLYRAQTSLFPLQAVGDLHRAALELVLTHVSATRVSLQLLDASGLAHSVLTLDHVARPVDDHFRMSTSVTQRVLEQRKVLLIRERGKDVTFAKRRSLILDEVSSVIAAPVFDGDEIFGLIYADVRGAQLELNDSEAAIVTLVASLLGTALVCARVVDGLTKERELLRAEIARLSAER